MQAQVLVVIPARGGSKGIPRKNIRLLGKYPLIAYSIAAGLRAETVTRVIVSTDDEEIASVARAYGAETPFIRPVELAQDQTTDLPVFEHALAWLAENEGYSPDVVVQLRPTSPFRPVNCVDDAVRRLLANPHADCVRGVVPSGQNPYKMWRLDEASGQMMPLLSVPGIDEPYNVPRQILPAVYWQTGHIDAIRPAAIVEKKSMSGEVILPVMIDPRYTVDLDNLQDWQRAEWQLSQGDLEIVQPDAMRLMPEKISMLVMDFDGVLTDNRVWVREDGIETVAANRSDSYGLNLLKKAGIQTAVISKERNPVVAARCKKMGVPCWHGIDDKATLLQTILAERGIPAAETVFVGNDLNDLPCFSVAGWAVAVADALPEVIRQADFVLSKPGGHGAVRELCDMILANIQRN